MAKTKAELRNRALVMLGKLPLGQTPTGALADDMEDAYDQIYARLDSRNMVTWSSTDSVPDEFVEDITALMAFERSEGIPNDRYVRIRDAASRAFGNISALISGPYTNPREYADF
jgi:hypothetical protein